MVHSTSVGIRHYLFHADKGFFLNGFPYILKGVCVHEDAGCFGAAVPWAVWYRRLIKLKEMGCNAIRMSHNPHMPELYDLCDRLVFWLLTRLLMSGKHQKINGGMVIMFFLQSIKDTIPLFRSGISAI